MAAVFGNKSFTINDWRVDPALNRVTRADEVIKIDPQNMRVLELLASRPGEVISQAEIEQTAWEGVIVTPNSVYQSIAQLRRALGDDKAKPKYIETIARKGYRCVAPVRSTSSELDSLATAKVTASSATFTKRSMPHLLGSALLILLAGAVLYSAIDTDKRVYIPAVTAETLSHDPSDEPIDVAAIMRMEAANAALTAARPNEALRHYESALELIGQFDNSAPVLKVKVLSGMAEAYSWNDEWERAGTVAQEAVQTLESFASEFDPQFIRARDTLAEALIDAARYQEAEPHIRQSIALSEKLYGPIGPSTLGPKMTLMQWWQAQGRWAEAEQSGRALLAALHGQAGTYAITAARVHTMLARGLYQQERYFESVSESRLALRTILEVARADHPYVPAAQQVLADSLVRLGKYDEAETLARECMILWKKADSAPWRIARARSTLGEVYFGRGHLVEAREYLTDAARMLSGKAGYFQRAARADNERRLDLLNTVERAEPRT